MPNSDHQSPKPSFLSDAFASFAQPVKWWWGLPRNEWLFWFLPVLVAFMLYSAYVSSGHPRHY